MAVCVSPARAQASESASDAAQSRRKLVADAMCRVCKLKALTFAKTRPTKALVSEFDLARVRVCVRPGGEKNRRPARGVRVRRVPVFERLEVFACL